ncbi:Nucleotide-binding universal stress protein, UspA family [Halovenus aranensis]|jgi:nucleotide-binding universal stress UspA family protein|uniref:Nucleotide-binding universal stress protein, UspA family n=1 Tax=Halovenus aranensis TaxID=890420 RepID=A0A1G8U7Z5_9EURY|nr:universal stress protein [Halovenus aranensis]SDJ49843.1 Nucleotide-binding universal stress protein, UspA family [Halovenus aranensis]
MYETVLVATDGSDAAHAAVEHAFELAVAGGSTVHVLTVVESQNPIQFGVAEVDELEDAARAVVADIATADDHDIEVHGEVRRGKPVSAVLDYARDIGADAIVAGQHGDDGLSEIFLGSTTERLAERADVPLVIVPADGKSA